MVMQVPEITVLFDIINMSVEVRIDREERIV